MRRHRVGRWLAAAAVAGVVVSGCAPLRQQPAEPSRDDAAVSAENLDDLSEEGSVIARADLEPEQREAVERAGMPTADGAPARPAAREGEGEGEGATDTAGKVSVSVLQVALSLAAVAAPFFLF